MKYQKIKMIRLCELFPGDVFFFGSAVRPEWATATQYDGRSMNVLVQMAPCTVPEGDGLITVAFISNEQGGLICRNLFNSIWVHCPIWDSSAVSKKNTWQV